MSLTSSTQSPPGQRDRFRDRLQAHTGVEVTDNEVHLQENQTARDQLRSVIRFMFNEGYITRDDLPIEAGEKRHLLHSEPVHQDGSEMVSTNEVVDGVYVELNYSTRDIQRRIRELVAMFSE